MLCKEDFEDLIGEMESLMETIEILSDKGLMKQIKESENDIKEGKVFEIKSEDDLCNFFWSDLKVYSLKYTKIFKKQIENVK